MNNLKSSHCENTYMSMSGPVRVKNNMVVMVQQAVGRYIVKESSARYQNTPPHSAQYKMRTYTSSISRHVMIHSDESQMDKCEYGRP